MDLNYIIYYQKIIITTVEAEQKTIEWLVKCIKKNGW